MDIGDDVYAIAVRDGAGEEAGSDRPLTATARCLPENLAKTPACAIGPNWRSVTCSPFWIGAVATREVSGAPLTTEPGHDDTPGDGLALQVAAAGDRGAKSCRPGLSRVATRTFTRPAPLLTLFR